ncbi:MAG: IPT/TIG domain-containing protein, partial [Candidatus Altiarchaeota archaeon]|nr:IPT/TIG domain-containing protein [Candidatus Altiarchaeota archaeon]
TGFWHQETNPELVSIISGINPELVSLPDNGYLPSAYSGSTVWWYGENSTGTFIGSDYHTPICAEYNESDPVFNWSEYNWSCQTAKNGGTSYAANTGNLISPTIDLTGVSNASLTFMSWYEIEGVDVNMYDMMYVYISTDAGVTYTQLGAINPINDVDGESFRPYSSGGLGLTGVWVSQHFDISSYASSQMVIKFTFDTVDNLYNGFRGWIIDDVMIGTTGAAVSPTIMTVAPSGGVSGVIDPYYGCVNGTIVSIVGTNFMNGATVEFGTTYADTASVASSSLIQAEVPCALADGTYDVTVTNPNGQGATMTSAFTVTTAYPPAISSISPTSGTNDQSTAVTITGSNFENGATVEVGGTTLSNIVVVSSTSITATVPAGLSGGHKNVLVTNPDSQYDVLMGGFYVNYTTSIDQAAVIRDLPSTTTAGGSFTATLELVLGDVPPNSVIINEFVPTGWTVTGSSPTYNSFNSATGEVKWILYGASLYAMNITYTVSVPANATGTGTFTGELKYNNVDGDPVTQTITGDTSIEISAGCALKGDTDCDGLVSDFELLTYVDLWVQGTVTDFDLLEAIDNWVNSG